jgi:hypothetical protein
MRCPVCKERVKHKDLYCWRCHTLIDEKDKDLQFINNGFKKVFGECENLEKDIGRFHGSIMRRHAFTEENLVSRIDKIKSFANKIRSDIVSWADRKKLSDKIREFYNENARNLQERLEELKAAIYIRKPTSWEKICQVFNALYLFVVEKILPILSFRLIPGKNPLKELGGGI